MMRVYSVQCSRVRDGRHALLRPMPQQTAAASIARAILAIYTAIRVCTVEKDESVHVPCVRTLTPRPTAERCRTRDPVPPVCAVTCVRRTSRIWHRMLRRKRWRHVQVRARSKDPGHHVFILAPSPSAHVTRHTRAPARGRCAGGGRQQSPSTGSSIDPGGRRFAAPEARNASRSPRPLGPGPVM